MSEPSSSTTTVGDEVSAMSISSSKPGLKKIPAYWYPYTTMAKERWLGRELLEVVSTEFRDRSMEYYRYALESGVTTINGKVAQPDTIVRNGDRIENVVHRHEPPVTSTPVQVLLHDKEREFIVVNKPGSIPVHASGRYYKNTLTEILENEFGFEKVYTVNRLDRLTSGLLILPLSAACARMLTAEFMAGTVKKEYVARCKGKFPTEEVVCNEKLLTVDRQMGLNIVHPEGKPATTIFNLIRYDVHTNSSVVRCRPITGRSHQIRVHLQFLGHPIANDSVYSETKIWGENLGKGGIDIVPSSERSAPAPPDHFTSIEGNPESLDGATGTVASYTMSSGATSGTTSAHDNAERQTKRLPRETGHDIGMGSPVPLSAEAVQVITRLRNMKDEDEDWSRWRDVVFRAKGRLAPVGVVHRKLPPPHRRERGGPSDGRKKKPMKESKKKKVHAASTEVPETVDEEASPESPALPTPAPGAIEPPNPLAVEEAIRLDPEASVSSPDPIATPVNSDLVIPDTSIAAIQLTSEEALSHASPSLEVSTEALHDSSVASYCPECFLPLHPDPKPERLYIFLHAKKYTLSLGSFETEMPEWAAEDWVWEKDE